MIEPMTTERRPGRPRDARVDVAVAEAAREVLREHGFGGATVEEIASRAGVGKAAIYRRWKSREELLFDVSAADIPDIPCPDTGSLRTDLLAVFTLLARQIATSETASYLGDIIGEAARNPVMAEHFAITVERRRSMCGKAVYLAAERGELREGIDPEFVIDLVSGPIFYRKLFSATPADDAYVEAVIDAVLRGVLAETD